MALPLRNVHAKWLRSLGSERPCLSTHIRRRSIVEGGAVAEIVQCGLRNRNAAELGSFPSLAQLARACRRRSGPAARRASRLRSVEGHVIEEPRDVAVRPGPASRLKAQKSSPRNLHR